MTTNNTAQQKSNKLATQFAQTIDAAESYWAEVKINGQSRFLVLPPLNSTHPVNNLGKLNHDRVSVVPDAKGLNPAYQIDTSQVVGDINRAMDYVNSQFTNMADTIAIMGLSITSGLGAFFEGLPGGGKTSQVKLICKALSNDFFSVLLGVSSGAEDLFGSINTDALKEGRWERVLSGLAVKRFAFLDEIGKAPSSVQNLLLKALEERLFDNGGREVQLPLHAYFGASNEWIESQALDDRFPLRGSVGYVETGRDFLALLGANGGKMTKPPTPQTANIDEGLLLLAAQAELMALESEAQFHADVMLPIFNEIQKAKIVVSNRRWKQALQVMAAQSLLNGSSDMLPESVLALQGCLWTKPNDFQDVKKIVIKLADPYGVEILNVSSLLERVTVVTLSDFEQMDMAAQAEQLSKLSKAKKAMEALKGKIGEDEKHKSAVAKLDSGLATLRQLSLDYVERFQGS